ncbi:MAG: DUF1501 domain-containing protein, partial [Pirellulaceae bacterium]
MHPLRESQLIETRRHFFGRSAAGIGTAALASLLNPDLFAAQDKPAVASGLPGLPHFAPKAKRVIYLFMSGAPSQLDMWDYKPKMNEFYDKDLPDSVRNGQRITTMTSGQKRFPIAPSIFKFNQHGKHGAWVSELLPHTAGVIDDLAVIRTVNTEAINHDPAITYIQTGSQLPGRPSAGAWLSYGLGSMNQNLPAFVVLHSTVNGGFGGQALYARLWGSGFLSTRYQGVSMRSTGDPVLYLSNPAGVSPRMRRRMLDELAKLNQERFDEVGDPEIQSRISQYEMAYRMQTSVPELTDISGESKQTLEMYGPEVTKPGTFAANCLLARRLAERDVRFTQVFIRQWDQHGNLPKDIRRQCGIVDQPCAALLNDLKQRGMLDDTLVIWGGEFGRTAYCQGGLSRKNYGRDHHPRCFTIWMAGGGIKGGITYGQTDDYAYNIADADGQPMDPQPDREEWTPGSMHIHDL